MLPLETGKERNGKHDSVLVVKLPLELRQPSCLCVIGERPKSSSVGGRAVLERSERETSSGWEEVPMLKREDRKMMGWRIENIVKLRL